MKISKILSVILIIVLMCGTITGCNIKITTNKEDVIDTTTDTNKKPTDINDNTSLKEDIEDTDTNINTTSTSYKLEFMKFDTSVLEYEDVFSFDIGANIIPFTSTQKPTEPKIEQFYTETEFRAYLDKYSDIQDNSKDNIQIAPETFNYSHGMSIVTVGGTQKDFYFIAHPDMPAIYDINVDEVYYNKETGDFYIVLVKDDLLKDEVKGSQTSYGILYMSIDEEFAKENKIGTGYIVMPE